MNSGQLPTDGSPPTAGRAEVENSNPLRDLTGRYYRILGWIDLASSAIALAICYWTGHVAITFFFGACFGLGTCLKRGIPAARKWAIAIPIIAGTLFAAALIFPALNLKLAPWGIDRTHPAFLPLMVIDLVVLAIPGLLLLGDRGRRAFTGENEPKLHDRRATKLRAEQS